MCRRRVLFVRYVALMEDTRMSKCVIFGELIRGASCMTGKEKEWMGCFLDDLRAFGIHADHSPRRGGMAKDGGIRGGTLHSEMDRCRESQDWTSACRSMPERDGKDQGGESPKEVCSCWFTRHS